MKLSCFTHFKFNLSKSILGAWATGYLAPGGARIDHIYADGCGRDLEFPKYVEVNSRTCLLLEQGLAYMSGRGIYDGSFDSK